VGEVELDEIVGGDDGNGERSDDNLDDHHEEEEDTDGQLWGGYSGALTPDIFGGICIAWALDGVHGEVHHGRE